MHVAIGMPAMIPGVDVSAMKEWATRAEQRGFSALVLDERLVWDGYDILIAAALVASVTERVKITTAVVLLALRSNAAVFAKQVASIDRLSRGRFTLGIGAGSRRDDFSASGVEFESRGKIIDAHLERITSIWSGGAEPIGPSLAPHRPELLFGGNSEATFRRIARYGAGWVAATSGGPEGLRRGAQRATQQWERAGRPGSPRLLALSPRFALGPRGDDSVNGYLRAYNAYRGDAANERLTTALTTPELVREQCARFEEAGCDELVISPCDPDPDQVDRLADALGGRCSG